MMSVSDPDPENFFSRSCEVCASMTVLSFDARRTAALLDLGAFGDELGDRPVKSCWGGGRGVCHDGTKDTAVSSVLITLIAPPA